MLALVSPQSVLENQMQELVNHPSASASQIRHLASQPLVLANLIPVSDSPTPESGTPQLELVSPMLAQASRMSVSANPKRALVEQLLASANRSPANNQGKMPAGRI